MMLMRRRRRTRSRGSSTIIRCDVAREAISALADDEEPPVAEAITAAHLSECEGCREFQASVVSLTRQMRLRVHAPTASRATEVLAALGCTDPASASASDEYEVLRWADRRRLSWVRATQWAAGVLPLGFAVPALALGVFVHIHIVPSHVLTPCTMSLIHQARRR
jgi:predicted anti-sigma-YlaC factor YlaD